MNDGMLTVSNSEFGKLNILVENGKELFPANDAAKLLGYTNPYGAVQKHCRSLLKREVPHPQSPDKKITVNFISEGDLYRLIIRSRLPAAATALSLPSTCRTSGWGAGVSLSTRR